MDMSLVKRMRAELSQKEAEFGFPASSQAIQRLSLDLQLDACSLLQELYASFDGAYDHDSNICIWDIERIISSKNEAITYEGNTYFFFADQMCGINYFRCCLQKPNLPVLLQFVSDAGSALPAGVPCVAAPDLASFFAMVLAGEAATDRFYELTEISVAGARS